MPTLIPNSLVGDIEPVVAETSVIKAPLKKPYNTIPMIVGATPIGDPVQNAKTVIDMPHPPLTNTVQIPNLSAMNPEEALPTNDPA